MRTVVESLCVSSTPTMVSHAPARNGHHRGTRTQHCNNSKTNLLVQASHDLRHCYWPSDLVTDLMAFDGDALALCKRNQPRARHIQAQLSALFMNLVIPSALCRRCEWCLLLQRGNDDEGQGRGQVSPSEYFAHTRLAKRHPAVDPTNEATTMRIFNTINK